MTTEPSEPQRFAETAPQGGHAEVGNMRCPECESRDVTCVSGRRSHVHECRACGYRTEAASVRR